MRKTTVPVRTLGLATAAYGAAVALQPRVLLQPIGFDDPSEDDRSALARLIGLRDLASGVAMMIGCSRAALQVAVAVRVGSDLADTVVLGMALRGREQRAKTLAVTAGWGLLCAASALTLGAPAGADRRR